MKFPAILTLLCGVSLAGCDTDASTSEVAHLADASVGDELNTARHVTLDFGPDSFTDLSGDRYVGPVDVEIALAEPVDAYAAGSFSLTFQGSNGPIALRAPITVALPVVGVPEGSKIMVLVDSGQGWAKVGVGDVQDGVFVGLVDLSADDEACAATDELYGSYHFLLEIQGIINDNKDGTVKHPSSSVSLSGQDRR